MAKILVVDDEPTMVAVLTEVLSEQRHEIVTANNADRAFEIYQSSDLDLVLTDIEMPENRPAGLDLLRKIKEHTPGFPVVMITGQASKERAVAALRAGAQDFIEKPFQIDELVKRVDTALFHRRAVEAIKENVELKKQLRDTYRPENIIGNSPAMQEVYRMINRVADTDSTVLILGESGTGKELVARALHYGSRRAAMPFVAVNCSALPEHLLESELFGHRKGAFTGAAFDKVGLFQHADGGTIFLDEMGSMAMGLQSKLLRFLQDKELRRVGDNDLTKVDVRVIAATNEPLQERVKEKAFREDLFYRLSVIPMNLPPLRERKEDIPVLIHHFFAQVSKRMGYLESPKVPDSVLRIMLQHDWPGNVRELQNAVERACALCDGGVVAIRDLPETIQDLAGDTGETTTTRAVSDEEDIATEKMAGGAQWTKGFPKMELKDYLHQQEILYIERAIDAAGGNKEKAAEMLGISMATLYRKLSPGEVT